MGKMVYLMGKSSTGKDTIYRELLKSSSLQLKKIVPYTTRPMRAGEKEGRECVARRTLYKMLKHSQRVVVLADNALTKRSYCRDVAGSPPEHLLSLASHLQHAVSVFVNSNNRRLFKYNTFALDINKDRGRAEVDTDILSHKNTSEKIICAKAHYKLYTKSVNNAISLPFFCNVCRKLKSARRLRNFHQTVTQCISKILKISDQNY